MGLCTGFPQGLAQVRLSMVRLWKSRFGRRSHLTLGRGPEKAELARASSAGLQSGPWSQPETIETGHVRRALDAPLVVWRTGVRSGARRCKQVLNRRR